MSNISISVSDGWIIEFSWTVEVIYFIGQQLKILFCSSAFPKVFNVTIIFYSLYNNFIS